MSNIKTTIYLARKLYFQYQSQLNVLDNIFPWRNTKSACLDLFFLMLEQNIKTQIRNQIKAQAFKHLDN